MAILSGIPVLNCQNIETSLAFYLQSLQFVVVNKREVDGHLDWAHIMHGSTTLMLQSIPSSKRLDQQQAQQYLPPISLYFFVDHIDELHHLLRAKKIVVSDVKVTHYRMKEFSLSDPDNNRIVIGQKSS